MKNYLLSALVCSSLLAAAQQEPIIPSVYNYPATGFRKITAENPYVLEQQMVSGQWTNYQLFTFSIAPNIDRVGKVKTSQWQSNAWKDVQIMSDSFVLDGQNRIATAIEESSYDYSGFQYQSKSKYIFTYDNANNRITKVNIMNAVPATSNNYSNYWNITMYYNPDGSRSYDSTYYYSQHESYVQYYNYNLDGDMTSVFGFNAAGDTSSKMYITYAAPGKTQTTFTTYLDETSDEWETSNADTFTYDGAGLVSNYISWGNVFDGTNLTFGPITNESYHYTASNKLDEIILRSSTGGAWTNDSKITILYNQDDKPVLGYAYAPSGNGWSSTASLKYLFDVPTGIASVYGSTINASVYPNPAKDIITIDFENRSEKIKEIKLFDLNGKSVSPVLNVDQTIDVSGLTNGIYCLTIITDNGASVQKISVQH